jgi:hypothetical protein
MIKSVRLVFAAYGGWNSVRKSSYLRVAIVLTAMSYGYIPGAEWTKLAQTIFPNLIGFSIAAMAIITVIGDDGFRNKMASISTIRDGESDMVSLMASFIWFIFVQVSALIFSVLIDARSFNSCSIIGKLICDSTNFYINIFFSSIGLFFFYYGITLVLSSAFLTFNIFRLYIGTINNAPNQPK